MPNFAMHNSWKFYFIIRNCFEISHMDFYKEFRRGFDASERSVASYMTIASGKKNSKIRDSQALL